MAMLRDESQMIANQTRMINGMQHSVMTVNGLDRVEINNKLHDLNEKIMKLRMEQDTLVQMRNQIDRECELQEMGSLFDQMWGG
jgi:hypothetical protein